MISRHWRGLVRPDRAAEYEHHLRSETFPALNRLPGFIDASILKRPLENGIEFLVVSRWASLESIAKFAGADVEAAVVPLEVQSMMIEYDRRARHYDVADGDGSPDVREIDNVQQQLLTLELALVQPATRKNMAQLTELLTEDFVEVGSHGTAFTRDEVIAALAQESSTQWTIENLKARPLADGVVLVTYRASRIRHGERVDALRSSIWKRDAGRWRMAFHQGTLART